MEHPLASGTTVIIDEMYNDDGMWFGTSYAVQAPFSPAHYNALVEFVGEDEFYRSRHIGEQLVYTFAPERSAAEGAAGDE